MNDRMIERVSSWVYNRFSKMYYDTETREDYEGYYFTKHGIVSFQRNYWRHDQSSQTVFCFIWKGKLYERTFNYSLSERSIKIHATKFANQIVKANP